MLRVLAGLAGGLLVASVVLSALRTVVLPRGEPVRLTKWLFSCTRFVFDLLLRTQSTFAGRDRVMGHYAPVTLLLLPFVWLGLSWLGFSAIYWAIEQEGVTDPLVTSGSSLTTLGFERPDGFAAIVVTFAEAALVMAVLALLLVTYLPSMYAAFSDREQLVSLFEVSAGTPPNATEMMIRYHRIRGMAQTERVWEDWERWFARIAESHTALPALVFFRSPRPEHSWVTSAGAVLDAAAMISAVIDLAAVDMNDADVRLDGGQTVHMPQAETCLRAGYLALRRIADQFDVAYDPDPRPGDPISVTREEFDHAYQTMAQAGVPLKANRDEAWRNWAGWRVNYEAALLGLANLTVAPPAPWTSDRSPVMTPNLQGQSR